MKPEPSIRAKADERFETMLGIVRGIEGFMEESNVAIWDSLLCLHNDICIQGNLMEIGVYKGKSASVLCQHRRPDEELWLVDFSAFIDEAQRNLSSLTPARVHFVKQRSSDLWRHEGLRAARRSFRWVHIDGEHTGSAVANDLSLASDLLADRGIVCVDDFFNPAYPQITAAVFQCLQSRPYELVLVLCGQNKGYLCRPTAARYYTDYFRNALSKDLVSRGIQYLTLFKTAPNADFAGWGIGQRAEDRDHYGLDENPDLIC